MADARMAHKGMRPPSSPLLQSKGGARIDPQRTRLNLLIDLLLPAFNQQLSATADERVNKYMVQSPWLLIPGRGQDPDLRAALLPQVAPLVAGSRVDRACDNHPDRNKSDSSNCRIATQTICVAEEELQAFHKAFCSSEVAYAITHGLGYIIQVTHGIKLTGAASGLQADFLAYLVLRMGSKGPYITRGSGLAMAKAVLRICRA
jgi:hypothetical protein